MSTTSLWVASLVLWLLFIPTYVACPILTITLCRSKFTLTAFYQRRYFPPLTSPNADIAYASRIHDETPEEGFEPLDSPDLELGDVPHFWWPIMSSWCGNFGVFWGSSMHTLIEAEQWDAHEQKDCHFLGRIFSARIIPLYSILALIYVLEGTLEVS